MAIPKSLAHIFCFYLFNLPQSYWNSDEDGGRPHSCYLDIHLQTVGNLVSTESHLYICNIILRLYNTVGQACGLSKKLLCLYLHVLDPDWRILQNKCFPLLLEFIHQLCFYRETRAQIVCEDLNTAKGFNLEGFSNWDLKLIWAENLNSFMPNERGNLWASQWEEKVMPGYSIHITPEGQLSSRV